MTLDDVALYDMLGAATSAREFLADLDEQAFRQDRKTQSAVMHQLLILGEAVKRVREAVRSRHAEIPWKLIAGMRDRLIHAYDEVNVDEVWRVVRNDVPPLIAAIRAILRERGVEGA